MKDQAYRQYQAESDNWLKRGRCRLLESLIRPVASRPVMEILEVGAGVGQNIEVLQRFGTVDAVETHPLGISALRKVAGLRELFSTGVPFALRREYDLICALDVIEHIEDDRTAVRWMWRHLKAGGSLLLVVPAYQWLYSGHDEALGHFRRYSRARLSSVLPADAVEARMGFFNSALFPVAAAMRLVSKAVGKTRDGAKKDNANVPPVVDSLLGGVLRCEAALATMHISAPWGLSLYWMGKKANLIDSD